MDARVFTELFQSIAAAVIVARLIRLGISGRFPALVAYLSFLAVVNMASAALAATSAAYFWLYLGYTIGNCGLGILAVRELFALTFADYPGIRTGGRWSMYAAIAVSTAVSLLFTGFFWGAGAAGRARSHLYYFEISERAVMFTLAVVISTILFFLSKYPLHLARNTWISSASFSLLFLTEAARLLIDSLTPQLHSASVDRAADILMSLCLAAWAISLGRERDSVRARVKFAGPDEEQLLEQLQSLNQLMARAVRR